MIKKSRAIISLIICVVVGIVLGLIIFLVNMWYIGEQKLHNYAIHVDIKTTTYKDGVPVDEYANGFYSEFLDEYSEFFKGTEFEDVYFVVDGNQPPKTADGVYNKDGIINNRYYFDRTWFWKDLAHKYKELISYAYTMGDEDSNFVRKYTGTAKVLAHDGTEHTEEFSTDIYTRYDEVIK